MSENLDNKKKPLIIDIDNVYAKQIWNEAIEAAINVAEINSQDNIRRLKK